MMRLTNVLAALAIMSISQAALASFVACPAGWTQDGADAKVYNDEADGSRDTAAGMCDILEPLDGNGNDDETSVNNDAWFGSSDWEFLGKDDFGDGLVFGDETTDPNTINNNNGQSGTWDLSVFGIDVNDYDTVMMIFKDGAGTNLVGFKLNGLFSDGKWETPFIDPPFDGADSKDVSHFSFYGVSSLVPPEEMVPEPDSLGLVSLSLLALGLGARRRRSRARTQLAIS